MSYQVVELVLEAQFPDLPPGPSRRRGVSRTVLNAVAVVLANKARPDGTDAHPGQRVIARHASVTNTTAADALIGLVELGVARRTPGDGRRADRYDLDLGVLADLACARPSHAQLRRAQSGAAARPSQALAPDPVRHDSPTVLQSAGDTSEAIPVLTAADHAAAGRFFGRRKAG